MDKSALFHPIMCSVQKIALYETKSKFFLVGSNITQTRFRVLKIDRMEPRELLIHDDKVEFTRNEIHGIINMIESGNRHRSQGSSFSNVTSAFGIVGFIRFLEGYYIILVTKRRKVAAIGHHTIYKIESTTMLYIPHDTVRLVHPDEPRYVKMFQNIDLSSNFYFSYSYDITQTLQHNLSIPKKIIPNLVDDYEITPPEPSLQSDLVPPKKPGGEKQVINYGVRSRPNRKFVWNTYLLEKVEKELNQNWILYITHGFIDQTNMTVFGRSIYVTLIARRSSKYAGTRFLKRGANFEGDVANEVETEQITHDSSVSSLNQSRFTSFVQMRGSIPGHWKQDLTKMVAKPTITIDLNDPYCETAAAHFNQLLQRYGSPIIVLNLVKKKEKKPQESLLSEELSNSIKYLNQFLPVEHQIQYRTFDMARKNKTTKNVMKTLGDIAKTALNKTGIFCNKPRYYSQKHVVSGSVSFQDFSLQTGIIRTNCVDCLDRTNTAQFAIGKCVLGYQLCMLGVIDTPNLEFDTDSVRMLESLYEDHGDTLALQYGGSQLVHRVKTYRKTAPWTSQGNDIMQTLSRYYSNTFSDADKQNTINLFLGLFIPDETKPPIWEFPSDYYLHHKKLLCSKYSLLTQWFDTRLLKCLPFALNDLTKCCSELIQVDWDVDAEMIDAYIDYHRPYELSVLNEVFAYKISNSIRDFMPNYTINYSPFVVRVRPGRRREETSNKNIMKNPSLTGQSSTSSTASSTSSSSGSDTSEDESSIITESQMSTSKESEAAVVTYKSLFPSMKDIYGTEPKNPSKPDEMLYKKYVLLGRRANKTSKSNYRTDKLMQTAIFSQDSSICVATPKIKNLNVNIYEKYIKTGQTGGFVPKPRDMQLYLNYASYK